MGIQITPTNKLVIELQLTCDAEVVKHILEIVAQKEGKPFDLISLFPAYLRTSQVFVSAEYGVDKSGGYSINTFELTGTHPVQKSAPLPALPQFEIPKEFNYVVVTTNDNFKRPFRYKGIKRLFTEFPNVPENVYFFQDQDWRAMVMDAMVFESVIEMQRVLKAFGQDEDRFLEEMVVYVGDEIGMHNGVDSYVLLNPKTYYEKITKRFGKPNN